MWPRYYRRSEWKKKVHFISQTTNSANGQKNMKNRDMNCDKCTKYFYFFFLIEI